jgi:hypothetical protein
LVSELLSPLHRYLAVEIYRIMAGGWAAEFGVLPD